MCWLNYSHRFIIYQDASINGNVVPLRPARISDRHVLRSLGKLTQEIQEERKQLKRKGAIQESPNENQRQTNPTKTTMSLFRFLLPKSKVTRKPFNWYDYENKPTTKRYRGPYD